MSIEVFDPAMPHLTDEKSVTIWLTETTGIHIHPWDRSDNDHPREVAVVVGRVDEFIPEPRNEDTSGEFGMEIVDRDDFIEAVLAVFPELRRSEVFS